MAQSACKCGSCLRPAPVEPTSLPGPALNLPSSFYIILHYDACAFLFKLVLEDQIQLFNLHETWNVTTFRGCDTTYILQVSMSLIYNSPLEKSLKRSLLGELCSTCIMTSYTIKVIFSKFSSHKVICTFVHCNGPKFCKWAYAEKTRLEKDIVLKLCLKC